MGNSKHYGIRNKKTGDWVEFGSGAIFWTTSKYVADLQLKRFAKLPLGPAPADWEVAEFD